MSDVRPQTLVKNKYLENRTKRFTAMSKTQRRIKIELNHTWRLRLLPVQMGPEKEPFVDIAQHWWMKQGIYCPRFTPEAWGGSPDADCPVCDVSDRLRESNSDDINKIGYRSRCNLRIKSWAIVFDKEDANGDVDDMPMSEILDPYEFDMYRTAWESFAKYQKWALSGRRGSKQASEYGLLDLESGCDLLATQGAKGIALDRCDPTPIFPLTDKNFDAYLEQIWSHIHAPKIILPDLSTLEDMAIKIEEFAENGGRHRRDDDNRGRGRGRYDRDDGAYEERDTRSRSRRSRSRYAEDSDSDPVESRTERGETRGREETRNRGNEREEATPSRNRTRTRTSESETQVGPAPRSSSLRQRPEPAEDAGLPADEKPEREERPPVEDRPARTTRNRAEPEDRPELSDPDDPDNNPEQQDEPAERPARPSRVRSSESAIQEESEPQRPPSARRGVEPAAPGMTRRTAPDPERTGEDADIQRPPRRTGGAPTSVGVDEEQDNVPEEKTDPAPALRETVDEAPPNTTKPGPQPKRTVRDPSEIRSRLERLNERGK